MDRLKHQLDHALLGVAVFTAGVIFQRTHQYHHRGKPVEKRPQVNQRKEQKEVSAIKKAQKSQARLRLNEWLKRSEEVLNGR